MQPDEIALEFDARQFTRADLILVGVLNGSWVALERDCADGLAATAALAAGGEEVAPDQVRAAVATMRRQRGLLAGDDYRAWREARGLTGDEVSGYARRELARALVPADRIASHTPDATDVQGVINVDAICSGTLGGCAHTLANWAAAARGLEQAGVEAEATDATWLANAVRACVATGLESMTEDELQSRAQVVAELHGAYEQFTHEAASDDKVDRTIAAHAMAWQHFRWRELVFASESAAREALMLVREDGLGIDDVVQLSNAASHTNEAYLDQLANDLGGVLMATPPGDLAGPLNGGDGDGWRLLQVAGRAAAEPGDPMLRARATDELVADALERHLVGRVKLHGEF